LILWKGEFASVPPFFPCSHMSIAITSFLKGDFTECVHILLLEQAGFIAIYFVVFMAKRASSPWDFLLAEDDVYSRLQ